MQFSELRRQLMKRRLKMLTASWLWSGIQTRTMSLRKRKLRPRKCSNRFQKRMHACQIPKRNVNTIWVEWVWMICLKVAVWEAWVVWVASQQDFNLVVVAQEWEVVCQTLLEWVTWVVVRACAWTLIQMNYLRWCLAPKTWVVAQAVVQADLLLSWTQAVHRWVDLVAKCRVLEECLVSDNNNNANNPKSDQIILTIYSLTKLIYTIKIYSLSNYSI
jgi:hypothetical protein